MTMTAAGLQTSRYQEILDRVKKNLFANISPDIDLSEDSAIGIIIGTIVDRIEEVHQIASEVYDSALITKAEGTSLDDLCALNDTYRYVAQPSSGQVEFAGDTGSVISPTTRIKTTAGDIFYPIGTFTLTPTQCIDTTLSVNAVVVGSPYTIIINNSIYTYTPVAADTNLTIMHHLRDLVNGGTIAKASVNDTAQTLRIYKDTTVDIERRQAMSVSATSYLTFDKVTINVIVNSAVAGAIPGLSGTLNTLESFPAGIDSVLNRYDLELGRDMETDEELRQRYLSGITVTGKGTSDAVLAAVKRIIDVSDAVIHENETETTDSKGIPAKSFEVVVVGGTDDSIAQAIWDTKPIGIRAYGGVQGMATDSAGGTHKIFFNRSVPKYVYVKLKYTLIGTEEGVNVPSASIQTIISESINEYGKTLGVGDDVIPSRIYGYIYKNIKGVLIEEIKCALAPNQATVPPDAQFKVDRLPIGDDEHSVWDSADYTYTVI